MVFPVPLLHISNHGWPASNIVVLDCLEWLLQSVKEEEGEGLNTRSTWCAVSRSLGSRTRTFRSRSLAPSDTFVHGSASNSSMPCITLSNTPCSVSVKITAVTSNFVSEFKIHAGNQVKSGVSIVCAYQPRMVVRHKGGCRWWRQRSTHQPAAHNSPSTPLVPRNTCSQPRRWTSRLQRLTQCSSSMVKVS